ncbi:hypothetical protein [Dyadobacter sp. 3J3]|uniref:hypothetical protein n=1 Tax=Dyadobacter sp. 3J3 TaxID=2606600 RepID=UPI00135734F5|nr:hypothetical protein [Dyadobacter sp. 3J3]
MFTSHIKVGQLIQIKTKGGEPPFKAPSLLFTGELVDEGILNFKNGCVRLLYSGEVAVQNDEGKVIGFEKGQKVLSIPRSIIESVEVFRNKRSTSL